MILSITNFTSQPFEILISKLFFLKTNLMLEGLRPEGVCQWNHLQATCCYSKHIYWEERSISGRMHWLLRHFRSWILRGRTFTPSHLHSTKASRKTVRGKQRTDRQNRWTDGRRDGRRSTVDIKAVSHWKQSELKPMKEETLGTFWFSSLKKNIEKHEKNIFLMREKAEKFSSLQTISLFCVFVCLVFLFVLRVTNTPLSCQPWQSDDLLTSKVVSAASWLINRIATQFNVPQTRLEGRLTNHSVSLVSLLIVYEGNSIKLWRRRLSWWVRLFSPPALNHWLHSKVDVVTDWLGVKLILWSRGEQWLEPECSMWPKTRPSAVTWILNYSLGASFVANFIWKNRI